MEAQNKLNIIFVALKIKCPATFSSSFKQLYEAASTSLNLQI